MSLSLLPKSRSPFRLRTTTPTIVVFVQSRGLFGRGKRQSAEDIARYDKLTELQKKQEETQKEERKHTERSEFYMRRSHGNKRKALSSDNRAIGVLADNANVHMHPIAIPYIPSRRWLSDAFRNGFSIRKLIGVLQLHTVTRYNTWKHSYTYIRPNFTSTWRKDLLVVAQEVYDEMYEHFKTGKEIRHPCTSNAFRRRPAGEEFEDLGKRKKKGEVAKREAMEQTLIKQLRRPVIIAMGETVSSKAMKSDENKDLNQLQVVIRFESKVERKTPNREPEILNLEECLLFRVDVSPMSMMDAFRAGRSEESLLSRIRNSFLRTFGLLKEPPTLAQPTTAAGLRLKTVEDFKDFKAIRRFDLDKAPTTEAEVMEQQIQAVEDMQKKYGSVSHFQSQNVNSASTTEMAGLHRALSNRLR
ncbi:hypothetical protein BT69DRAFT_570308 [Atractiella rhizophila]|nr:hypothetical protein BT69DRAFT_570308 [Atractiella rhizophila]